MATRIGTMLLAAVLGALVVAAWGLNGWTVVLCLIVGVGIGLLGTRSS